MPDIPTNMLPLVSDLASETLVKHWLSLPRPEGAHCPYRTDLDLESLGDVADWVFMDEWHSEDVVCIVRSGNALSEILGADLTGHNMMLLLPEEEYVLEQAFFKAVFQTPCAGQLTRHGSTVRRDDFIYRTTYLPLLSASGEVRFTVGTGTVLGGKATQDQFGYTDFGAIELLEREVCDIGAGVPKLEVVGPAVRRPD